MKNTFVHLRVHSNFSLAEGMLSFDYLSNFCIQNLQPAIAITDTSNMFGALEFSIKMASSGIQPIIGMQVNICGSSENEVDIGEVVLIAKNEIGYKNLLTITSHLDNNVNFEKFVKWDNLTTHSDGLILLTGGIEKGFIGYPSSLGNIKLVNSRLRFLKSLFNDNLYIEIQRHGLKNQIVSEKNLIEAADNFNLPIVGTNDCFFESPNKLNAHQILTCIDKGLTISSPNRRLLTKEHYLKNNLSMTSLFADIPEAIENTIVIAKRCSFFPKSHKPILPQYPGLKDISENDYLSKISYEGLKSRFQSADKKNNTDEMSKYLDRLKLELTIINEMGFSGYFLIVYDFIKWSKDNHIPVGPGRGSGAGSIVAWSLKITDLDPIKWGLLFERFLNPERVSMPDFDIDFCQDRREEVIQYVRNRYGHDRVAQIITFGSLQAKAAVRDVGRVMEMPYGLVDKIAKLIPFVPSKPMTIKEAIEAEDALKQEIADNEQVEQLIKTAIDLEGLNRHASTHAAGLVIGDRPLNELVPLYRFNDDDIPATQFNMKFVEKAGLVKFDFLGLKTLTVLSKAETLIKAKNEGFNLAEIPLDNKKTFQMLSTGSTVGVFQLESAGMKDVLIGLKPDRFEDIIAVVSLYRPGPMENIPTYINRKHGKEKIIYMHASLEEILKETYGIFIYQEQVLRAAQILADFSLGSADILRRAMGKKDKNEMSEQKQSFILGAKNKNISENKAIEIFDQISAFAGYGFNKSHAAAYALIAYQTAWIKCNYPHEFFASMMTIEYNNSEKLSLFIEDLKKINISTCPPCINNSTFSFIIQKISEKTLSIRYSLSALKNIGHDAAQRITDIRFNKGNFISVDDFLNKVPYTVLSKKLLESLIMSGAFDCLENNRNKLFKSIDLMLNYSQGIEKEKISNQQNLFNQINNNHLSINLPETYNWGEEEKLNNEFSSLGLYLSTHPLNNFLNILNDIKTIKSSEIYKNPSIFLRKNVKMCGLPSKFQKRQSSRGKWATFHLNDLGGNCEVTLYSDIITKYEHLLTQPKPVLLDTDIKNDSNQGLRIIVKKIMLLEEFIMESKLNLVLILNDQSSIIKFKPLFNSLCFGPSNIFVECLVAKKTIRIKIRENIKLSKNLLHDLSNIRGIKNIVYT